ncbi:hypothetical protein [Gorillibacterium sp. CAU 1737]|uniref:hypothetical protein n=1 Tax=Gorillibacterium sp. CAU 1737 TaxID=3140362 RepID=UPI003260AA42
MGRIIGFLVSIPLFALYPFVALFVLIAPVMCLVDEWRMISSGAPLVIMPLAITGLFGLYLFMTVRWNRMRVLYEKVPVLLPTLQIAYVMLVVTNVGEVVLRAWADEEALPKSVAILLAVLLLVLGRAYLSYWYAKYPISSKVRREGLWKR